MGELKRRDREEIICQILKAAVEPVTRTRLIYASFLSNSELRQYIIFLTEQGLLEVDLTSSIKFKVTEKGRKFVKLYEEMRKMTIVTYNNNLLHLNVQRHNAPFQRST